MTVKYMKKSKLQMIDGTICNKKGEVLGINPKYAELFNQLETKLQEKDYLDAQPEATPMPSLDGFVREHATGNVKIPTIQPMDTPTIDKRIDEAIAFAEEMEKVNKADEVNNLFEEYALLFQFVENDSLLVNTELIDSYEFDLVTLGNPLTMTKDDLAAAILDLGGIPTYEMLEED